MKDELRRRLWNLATLVARPRPPVGTTPADVVHEERTMRVLRYRPRAGGVAFRTPVLLVPSLINRHYVLDLVPGKSFAEHLVAQGHDVYAIDWGTPNDEDRHLDLDTIVGTLLDRAVRRAGRPHVLGYCLGGTLAAVHAAVHPDRIASLCAVAAPVRFHDDGLLSAWTRTPGFDVRTLAEATGNVPWQIMQSAFHLLRPTLSLSKAVHLVDRAWDDNYLDGFLALETWGNDNVAFPGAAYVDYVERLWRADGLVHGTFTLAGRRADLAAIRCPLVAVTFEHDQIVPWRSAAELLERVSSSDREHIHLQGGHVGAMVSRAASKTLWPRLSAWWAARDGAPAVSAKRSGRASPASRASRASRPPPAPRPADRAGSGSRGRD